MSTAVEAVAKTPELVIYPEQRAEILDFSYEIPALGEKELTEKMPWNGWVAGAIINWPDGCNNLVGVRITVDDERMIPKNTSWIALNNVTVSLPLIRRVRKDRLIKVNMKNNDDTYSHFITVMIGISYPSPYLPKLLL
jgi:hypothetical protein